MGSIQTDIVLHTSDIDKDRIRDDVIVHVTDTNTDAHYLFKIKFLNESMFDGGVCDEYMDVLQDSLIYKNVNATKNRYDELKKYAETAAQEYFETELANEIKTKAVDKIIASFEVRHGHSVTTALSCPSENFLKNTDIVHVNLTALQCAFDVIINRDTKTIENTSNFSELFFDIMYRLAAYAKKDAEVLAYDSICSRLLTYTQKKGDLSC